MSRPDALFDALIDYAKGSYPVQVIAAPRCGVPGCRGEAFRLAVDDNEGAAVRTCALCQTAHPIADSAYYLDGAALEDCTCPCGKDVFSLRVGVPISDLARDMGHASVELTMTTYGHWASDHGRESARLRERFDATPAAPMLGTMVEP